MAARAHDARASSRRPHEAGGGGGAAPHVRAVRGVGGDGGDLDELAQRALVFGPQAFSELIEVRRGEGRPSAHYAGARGHVRGRCPPAALP